MIIIPAVRRQAIACDNHDKPSSLRPADGGSISRAPAASSKSGRVTEYYIAGDDFHCRAPELKMKHHPRSLNVRPGIMRRKPEQQPRAGMGVDFEL